MTSQPIGPARGPAAAALNLEYPMSLGVYDTYADAQKAVDYLSDNDFPVQNLLIVGTDLKSLERVTGRLTRARVAMGGALSGAWLGAFVGLIFSMFESGSTLARILSTVVFGALFGLVWAMIGYALTRGQRDFTSVSQVVATRYEVLTEHKLIAQGRDLLTKMDPMKAAQAQVAEAQARAYAEAQRDQGDAPAMAGSGATAAPNGPVAPAAPPPGTQPGARPEARVDRQPPASPPDA